GHLLPYLGKGCGERVVDSALRLLNGVGHRIAPLTALGPRPSLRARFAAGGGRRRGFGRSRASRRLFGLLQAEAQAMPLGIEADDLELERLALVDDITRVSDALLRELAD